MDRYESALAQAFQDYRRDAVEEEKKRDVTEGLLGFGRRAGDSPAQDRFDARVEEIVGGATTSLPTPAEAEGIVRQLLLRDPSEAWPAAAQWMLIAAQRHCLPLIPMLSPAQAGDILKAYEARYAPWERLPAQKRVIRALKARSEAKQPR